MKKKIKWPVKHQTKRLVLRSYKMEDYEAWILAYTSRKPKQHKYDRGPHDPKETPKKWFRKLMAKHARMAKRDETYVLGLFEKKSGRHIGVIDISTISRDHYQWANLGYVIHNTEQRKGYGSEAAKAGIQVAFTHLKYHRVEAAINVDNKRSIALAKSIGMKPEGIRKKYIFENKKWTDHEIFVALNPSRAF